MLKFRNEKKAINTLGQCKTNLLLRIGILALHEYNLDILKKSHNFQLTVQ
jgi:hypothetical protein